MASSATPVNPELPVTIKLSLDGTSRRFKLPLRDLGVNVLEPKLRDLLDIPADAEVIFERYSDSASAYVVLDRNNPSIYKQLGRAAKAKQKLKIRATTKRPEVEEPKKGPKPASVEDAVEEEGPVDKIEETQPLPEAENIEVPSQTVPAAEAKDDHANSIATLESTLEAIQNSIAAAAAAAQSKLPSPTVELEVPTCTTPSVAPSASAEGSVLSSRTCRTSYLVSCNSCDQLIPEVHYHCSTCDDGDFDLCQGCVDRGTTCHGEDHWLIKRFVKNGQITKSTTERIAPKVKAPKSPKSEEPTPASERPATAFVPTPERIPERAPERVVPVFRDFLYSSIRTCNCCVQELPEVEFVHCTTCEDFDLCRACFAKNRHGHHPKHGFVAAVEGTRLENEVSRRLNPGRGQVHNAICDGCDEEIRGIRHKCLDCPDWDYCSSCIPNASFVHPDHRFVPIYEQLEAASNSVIRVMSRPTHHGICCDGPLCSTARTGSIYIIGDRYKCAVCDDTDFCANCEASPANNHNKTHPLIKFKTPVRHVSVTTTGEHENGRVMPTMGDRLRARPSPPIPETIETIVRTNIQTVVDMKPSAPTPEIKAEKPEIKLEEEAKPETPKTVVCEESSQQEPLVATFVRDTVPDDSVMEANHVFEQTWFIRNDGNVPWPAGCSIKWVGGVHMGHLDTNHPAATQDLESSLESTISYAPVAPGEEFPFTVLLRTPNYGGRAASNWRLMTRDGQKFGHRLWCDVLVKDPVVKAEPEAARPKSTPVKEMKTKEAQQSQMIFPKLEKESPQSSIHEEAVTNAAPRYEEEFEDCAEDDAWVEDDSDAFLTDEEYDILDASDEEFHQGK